MELALIVAVIRTDKLGPTEKALNGIGVRGITVIKARGFRDQSLHQDILGRALMDDQAKIEIYATREQSERIATTIMEAAHTGSQGDGIVAILPVDRVFSVRTRSAAIPNCVRA